VADFPASLADDFAEEIPVVYDADHGVGKVGMAEDLGVTERVLVRHQNLEVVAFNIIFDHLGRNCALLDLDMDRKAANLII